MPVTLESEFMRHVTKTDGCWLWNGRGNRGNGYGSFGQLSAHRFSYMLFVGAIPDGYDIHHICGVRKCVNWAHLKPLPHCEHIAGAPARNAVKTHCINGHEFTPDNTELQRRGGRVRRQCRACRKVGARKYSLAYYHRKKALCQ